MMTDFQNSFAVTFSGEFVIKPSLTIPPYLQRFATLPCGIFHLSESRYSQFPDFFAPPCRFSYEEAMLYAKSNVREAESQR